MPAALRMEALLSGEIRRCSLARVGMEGRHSDRARCLPRWLYSCSQGPAGASSLSHGWVPSLPFQAASKWWPPALADTMMRPYNNNSSGERPGCVEGKLHSRQGFLELLALELSLKN